MCITICIRVYLIVSDAIVPALVMVWLPILSEPLIVPPAFGKAATPVAISVLIEFANLAAVTWSSDICLVSTPFVTIFVAVT